MLIDCHICLGYNPAFAAWNVTTVKQSVANMALSVLADAVLRVATRLNAPIIDLRRVMNKAQVMGHGMTSASSDSDGLFEVSLLLERILILFC